MTKWEAMASGCDECKMPAIAEIYDEERWGWEHRFKKLPSVDAEVFYCETFKTSCTDPKENLIPLHPSPRARTSTSLSSALAFVFAGASFVYLHFNNSDSLGLFLVAATFTFLMAGYFFSLWIHLMSKREGVPWIFVGLESIRKYVANEPLRNTRDY